MLQTAYEIRDRYLHEWLSTGKEALHRDMSMEEVEHHVMIGKALKEAVMACHVIKEMGGEKMDGANPYKMGHTMPSSIKV